MKKFIFITAIMSLSVLFLIGCTNNELNSDGISKATDIRYAELEIREYKGERLDPSVGPRDNSISGIKEVDISDYKLKIAGLVNQEISADYNEILNLESYEKLITLHCVEGWDATVLWKGPLLTDVIDLAGANADATTVIFHCADGYTTAIPYEEIQNRNMILAYSSNGITLPESLGFPFIVVAEDKLGYKWARWVDQIILSDDEEYLGYWENRGYENEANVVK